MKEAIKPDSEKVQKTSTEDQLNDSNDSTASFSPPPFNPTSRYNLSSTNNAPIQMYKDYASYSAGREGENREKQQAYFGIILGEFQGLYKEQYGVDFEMSMDAKTIPEEIFMNVVAYIQRTNTNLQKGEIDDGKLEKLNGVIEKLKDRASRLETVRNSTVGALASHENPLREFLSRLPITTLASMRCTNRFFKRMIDSQVLMSMKSPYGEPLTLHVTFEDVNNHMQQFDMRGLHGSTESDADGLYSGITPRPAEEDRVYKTSQLGEGFYLTDGAGVAENVYARSVGAERKKTTGKDVKVFRVFINKTVADPVGVEKGMWADMERDITPSALEKLSGTPNILTSPIVQNEHVKQLKVNAPLFDQIQILPPSQDMDEEFDAWLIKLLENNVGNIGKLE